MDRLGWMGEDAWGKIRCDVLAWMGWIPLNGLDLIGWPELDWMRRVGKGKKNFVDWIGVAWIEIGLR